MKKKAYVTFEKKDLLRFKQEWMTAKTDDVDCSVCIELEGTRLQIVINGESYVADISELANSLINRVVPRSTL